jgi:hypothetical protein
MTTNIIGGAGTVHPMATSKRSNPQSATLENQIKELRAEVHAQRGDIATLKSELAILKSAVVKEEGYLEFLRQRSTARVAAQQQ